MYLTTDGVLYMEKTIKFTILTYATVIFLLLAVLVAGGFPYEFKMGVALLEEHSDALLRITIRLSIAIGLLTWAASYFRREFFPRRATVEVTVSRG